MHYFCQKSTLFFFLFIYLILQAATGTMNGIIDTVAAVHPLKPLLDLLKTNGKLILVGAQSLEKPLEVPAMPLYGKKNHLLFLTFLSFTFFKTSTWKSMYLTRNFRIKSVIYMQEES